MKHSRCDYGSVGNCYDLEDEKLRPAVLFWDFTQPEIVGSYRRFGTTYRSQPNGWSSPRKQKYKKLLHVL